MTTNQRRRAHLDAMKDRLTFVTGRARHRPEKSAGFDRREVAALEWAIACIEAAQLLGTLDELETVAKIEPEMEAWASRGTVVSPTRGGDK